MKSFRQFVKEVYDAEFRSGANVQRADPEGRMYRNRKKDPKDIKRTKAVGGKKTAQSNSPTIRKDAGGGKGGVMPTQDKEKSKQSYADHLKSIKRDEYRREKAGLAPKDYVKSPEKKEKKKVDPKYKPQKATGWTRQERGKITHQGEKLVRDIQKGKERNPSSYKPFK